MKLHTTTFGDLIDATAAKTPAPGGGAAASMIAAIGGSLLEMVLRYTQGSAKYAEHASLHDETLRRLPELRRAALDLAAEDVVAYERLNALLKRDRDDPQRVDHMPEAVAGAIDVPRRALALALELLELCGRLVKKSNRQLRSDLAIAAIAAEAAAAAAGWNIRVNLPLLDDDDTRSALEGELAESLDRAAARRREIEAACR